VGAGRGRKVANRVDWCPKWVREEGERSPIGMIGALSEGEKRKKGRQYVDWCRKSVREDEERSSIELIGALSRCEKRKKGRQ
jgi:hypothetical protein